MRVKLTDNLRDLARNVAGGYGTMGRRNARLALAYAGRRDSLNRLGRAPRPGPRRVPGPRTRIDERPHGVVVRFEHATLEVSALAPDLVVIGWDGTLREPSYAVVPWQGDLPAVTVTESRDGDCLLHVAGEGGLTVAVSGHGAVTVRDASGAVRRADDPPEWRDPAWTLRTALREGAVVMGLGGRAGGPTGGPDLRGGTYRLWNSDPGGSWEAGSDPLYTTTPAYVLLDDEGAVHCFMDDSHDGQVAVGARGDAGAVVTTMTGGPLRYSVAVGDLRTTLDRFTELTGRPCLPPRWALGHHQSRWGYRDTAAIRNVWRGFAERELPLSAIHLDIDHMDSFRDFTLDVARFGDLPRLASRMAAKDVHLVAILDAGVAKEPGDPTFDSGNAFNAWVREPARPGTPEWEKPPFVEGVLWPGVSVYPDFTDPEVREWWGERYADHLDRGFAGFWHDMNEPSSFAAWGETSLPRGVQHDLDGQGGDHHEAHNLYGMLMNRAAYEGLVRLRPGQRPFLFSRSGWAGQQRYAGNWTGDIRTHWGGLRLSLAYTLGLGVSGVPFSGPDIGGFTGDPDPEMYARWFELAAWLPFFRSHGSLETKPREPWNWPREVQDALRAALRWRYRLLPYWYTLAREAGGTGAPYVRPLAWADPSLRHVDDTFLVGDHVAVAPVLDKGVTRRSVTLPRGTWYDAASGQAITGGRPATISAPLGRVPWFVRAGSVIPMEVNGALVLMTTPPEKGGPAGSGTLWTDDGDGWDDGRLETYRLEADDAGGWLVRRTVEREGPFPWSGATAAGLGFPQGTRVRLETGTGEAGDTMDAWHPHL